MATVKPPEPTPTTPRSRIFKILYVAVTVIAIAAGGGLGYFKLYSKEPEARLILAKNRPQELKMPEGAILIPAGDGLCRMHALDNATGQIMNYGVVNCSQASEQTLETWRRAMSKDRFVEIGKSFRHEGGPAE